MATDIGELVARLRLDNKGFQKELRQAQTGLTTLKKVAVGALSGWATTTAVKQFWGTLIKSVEEYNMAVIQTSALVTGMMAPVAGQSIADQYAEAKVYALGIVSALEELDAKTILTAGDLGLINRELLKQGILLDTNNEKQIQGFLNLSNAIATISAGAPNLQIQLMQETRALLQGQVNANSQLASMMGAQVGNLKEQVELHKQQGDLIEWLGEQLKGFGAAAKDLEGTWQAIGSTMETIYRRTIREGLTTAFQDILSVMQQMSTWAKEHQQEIAFGLANAWDEVKKQIIDVWELAKGLKSVLDLLPDGVVALATAFAFVAKSPAMVALIAFVKVFKESYDAVRDSLEKSEGVKGTRTFPIDMRTPGYNEYREDFKKPTAPPVVVNRPDEDALKKAAKEREKEAKRIKQVNKDYWDALAGSYDAYTQDPDAARMGGMQDAKGRVAEMIAAAKEIEEARRPSFEFISEEMRNASTGWLDGARAGLEEYYNMATDTFTNVSAAFGGAMSSMEDFLVDFVTTGKLNFRDLVNSILEDLARLMIRQTITGPIASALSGALSGGFGGGAGAAPHAGMDALGNSTAFHFASGGIASGPTSGYGATLHGTEAVIPLSGGRSIPVDMKGAGGTQVIINNNSGQPASVKEGQTGDGLRQVLITIGNDIRSMGPVGQAIGSRFGLAARGMA